MQGLTKGYFIQRILMWFITIFIGVTLVFIIPRIGKGDPITSVIMRIMNQQGYVENAEQIIEFIKSVSVLTIPGMSSTSAIWGM